MAEPHGIFLLIRKPWGPVTHFYILK
jgi:hypothetical protein